MERIEQKNNVNDEFNEYVSDFFISYLPSTFDKPLSGFLTILISNELCRQVSWGDNLLLFFYFLIPKLTIIFLILS